MNDLVLYKSEKFQDIECDFWKNENNENNEIFMTSGQLGNALGFLNPKKGISNLVNRNDYLKDMKFSSFLAMRTEAGLRETRLFTEDGIYEVAFIADTEKAKEFRSWVREILKGLRKGELELLQKQIDESKPKLQLYEQVLSSKTNFDMKTVAKSLKLMGRNKLFSFLRSEKILMSGKGKHNIPYQQFCDTGYFSVVLKSRIIDDEIINFPVTLVSSKGIEYILKRLEDRKKKDLVTNQAN
jgi:phage antirepressor YoqD-like protein